MLLVETVNINPKQMARALCQSLRTALSSALSGISDTEIVYQFTVEDDNLYLQP